MSASKGKGEIAKAFFGAFGQKRISFIPGTSFCVVSTPPGNMLRCYFDAPPRSEWRVSCIFSTAPRPRLMTIVRILCLQPAFRSVERRFSG
jgi:hypothetical protein